LKQLNREFDVDRVGHLGSQYSHDAWIGPQSLPSCFYLVEKVCWLATHMLPLLLSRVANLANAETATQIESVQSLWSGYGQIVRVRLLGVRTTNNATPSPNALPETAIVKHVCPPQSRDHKYGWSGDVSHQRKLRSYDNETNWYLNASEYCGDDCRVPHLLGADLVKSSSAPKAETDDSAAANWLLVMEDLDAAGFHLRHSRVTDPQVDACLGWLANFHATFLVDTARPIGPLPAEQHQLWPIGTYWHLDTRPDEFAVMEDSPLKRAAAKIDATLNNARFQTLVHGDAKLANFCFAENDQVAAVDFQYVGGGCGMKDVAYFISSCFSDTECEQREQALLDNYFQRLKMALTKRQDAPPVSFDELELECRKLYSFAWADFYRFLAGWSPGHWKIHGYSERMTQMVLNQLGWLPQSPSRRCHSNVLLRITINGNERHCFASDLRHGSIPFFNGSQTDHIAIDNFS